MKTEFTKRLLIGGLLLLCGEYSNLSASQRPVKLFQINSVLYAAYAGNYRLSAARVISIGPFSEAGGRPVFYDSQTRRLGVLYPVSDAKFVTGTIRDDNMITPFDLQVTFVRNGLGRITSLIWREGAAPPRRALRVRPHRDEEVVFHNGGVTLHGTLTLPETNKPHPVVIFLQEAGPRSRPYGMWPYLFAYHGIAMLTFDKRGVGASTGDWQHASFADLAGDALAAIALLRARSDINARQIGLWGNSNSGWILPLVAAHSTDVAFIINRVGSSLPPTENVLYEIENQMRGQGFSEQEIAKAVNLRRLLQNTIITNEGWAEVIKSANSARNERWFPMSRVGRYLTARLPPDPLTLQQWRNPLDFDPIPYWRQVTCPVLALYGELDTNTPTARNVPLLIDALKQAGNKRYKIIILPKADHPFYEFNTNRGDYISEIPALQRFVPGYVDGVMRWLREMLHEYRSRDLRLNPNSQFLL
jgi:uncharacterized protein